MENINEAPVVAAATKVVAGLAKAGAKAAAKGGKVAAKSSKNISKAVSKFKRPNIRSYKDPKTGKVNLDQYRSDQAKYKKIQQDKKNRPDMSDIKPDGPSDSTEKRNKLIKKGLKTTGDVGQKVASTTGRVIKKTAKAIGSGSSVYGTSSFSKESKITFQEFIDKIP